MKIGHGKMQVPKEHLHFFATTKIVCINLHLLRNAQNV